MYDYTKGILWLWQGKKGYDDGRKKQGKSVVMTKKRNQRERRDVIRVVDKISVRKRAVVDIRYPGNTKSHPLVPLENILGKWYYPHTDGSRNSFSAKTFGDIMKSSLVSYCTGRARPTKHAIVSKGGRTKTLPQPTQFEIKFGNFHNWPLSFTYIFEKI